MYGRCDLFYFKNHRFRTQEMGVGASSTEVPITFESITLLWRRFRHRDLAGSIRLDVLHVTVLLARPYAAYEGEKTPPLCLGSRQPARVAGLGGRSTRPSQHSARVHLGFKALQETWS